MNRRLYTQVVSVWMDFYTYYPTKGQLRVVNQRYRVYSKVQGEFRQSRGGVEENRLKRFRRGGGLETDTPWGGWNCHSVTGCHKQTFVEILLFIMNRESEN